MKLLYFLNVLLYVSLSKTFRCHILFSRYLFKMYGGLEPFVCQFTEDTHTHIYIYKCLCFFSLYNISFWIRTPLWPLNICLSHHNLLFPFFSLFIFKLLYSVYFVIISNRPVAIGLNSPWILRKCITKRNKRQDFINNLSLSF